MQYMQAKRGPGLILIYLYPKVGATHNPGNSYLIMYLVSLVKNQGWYHIPRAM